ncbi:hypothetical protein MJM95_29075, partial [Salmonella enterica subsp. enterica serovar Anatum]|nr:hypothetical protein [Salmonella enterica subsp. enterica serovar Anatum]
FLFVLFIFSFLDRINIGFAGLTMGQDLGLSATMFGLATTLFYTRAQVSVFAIFRPVFINIVILRSGKTVVQQKSINAFIPFAGR